MKVFQVQCTRINEWNNIFSRRKHPWSHTFNYIKLINLPKHFNPLFTTATGAKNHRHESRTDEDAYLYLRTCSAYKQAYNLQRKNWNKTNALVNVPKKETHHESDDLNRINSREFTCLPLFALLVTHKEKRQSFMPVNLKMTEFAPVGVQAEVPLAPSIRKRPVREAKFNLKNYTGWNANSYIYISDLSKYFG